MEDGVFHKMDIDPPQGPPQPYPEIHTTDLPDLPEPNDDGTLDPPELADEGMANDQMRHIAHWMQERERVQHSLDTEVMKLRARAQTQLDQIERHIAWHESGLQAWLWHLGVRSWKGLYGAVRINKGRQRIEIEDEDEFMAWAAAQPEDVAQRIIKTTRRPAKGEISKLIKASGEIPPGTDVVIGEERLTVKPAT